MGFVPLFHECGNRRQTSCRLRLEGTASPNRFWKPYTSKNKNKNYQ